MTRSTSVKTRPRSCASAVVALLLALGTGAPAAADPLRFFNEFALVAVAIYSDSPQPYLQIMTGFHAAGYSDQVPLTTVADSTLVGSVYKPYPCQSSTLTVTGTYKTVVHIDPVAGIAQAVIQGQKSTSCNGSNVTVPFVFTANWVTSGLADGWSVSCCWLDPEKDNEVRFSRFGTSNAEWRWVNPNPNSGIVNQTDYSTDYAQIDFLLAANSAGPSPLPPTGTVAAVQASIDFSYPCYPGCSLVNVDVPYGAVTSSDGFAVAAVQGSARTGVLPGCGYEAGQGTLTLDGKDYTFEYIKAGAAAYLYLRRTTLTHTESVLLIGTMVIVDSPDGISQRCLLGGGDELPVIMTFFGVGSHYISP